MAKAIRHWQIEANRIESSVINSKHKVGANVFLTYPDLQSSMHFSLPQQKNTLKVLHYIFHQDW
jgi:hypothetical protein